MTGLTIKQTAIAIECLYYGGKVDSLLGGEPNGRRPNKYDKCRHELDYLVSDATSQQAELVIPLNRRQSRLVNKAASFVLTRPDVVWTEGLREENIPLDMIDAPGQVTTISFAESAIDIDVKVHRFVGHAHGLLQHLEPSNPLLRAT